MRPLGLVICGMALALSSFEASSATIGGKTYETSGGNAYLVDSRGEYWRVVPDLIEIKFESDLPTAMRDSFVTANELTETPFLISDDYSLYRYPLAADPLAVLDEVLAWDRVENAILNFENKDLGDPHFTFDKQWNMYLVKVDRALEVTPGTSEVVVAIHDQGVDRDHADLSSTRWTNPLDSDDDGNDDDMDFLWFGDNLPDDSWGWNFDATMLPEVGSMPWPITEHGTPVAGIVAAANDNSEGIASPGGGSSASRPIRWLSVIGRTSSTFAFAVDYCRHKGVDIINQSFRVVPEQFGNKRPGVDAIRAFAAAGGLVVAAAGNNCENDATPEVVWPASIDSVFAVGAVDSLLNHWDYSCNGPEIDLVAPAGYWHLATEDSPYHWSTDNYEYDHAEYNPGFCGCAGRVTDGRYTLFGGTSAAAPLVAGVAALVWSQRPELTAPQVKALLRRSARDLGAPDRDDDYGYGLVDAYRAVTRWGTLGQTNYWSGEIHVSGDLTVAANDSLVLAPGTFIRVARDDNEFTGTDTTLIEILVHGTLLADSVTFTSFGSGSPGVSDWMGIRIATGGKAVLNCVQIENASDDIIIDEFGLSVANWDTTKTLYLNSDLAIAANFTLAAEESLFVLGGSDVIISGGSDVEIVVEGSLICKGSATKKPEFRSSTGQASSWKLLALAGGSENNLFHNVVFRHAEQAIRTFVPLWVDSCSFSDGIDGIQNHDDLVVRNSTFSDLSSSAFSVVGGDLFVQNVAVSGCGWGILQQPVDTTVSTGTIECIESRIQDISYRGINIHYPTDGVTIKHTLIENALDGAFLGYQDSVVIDSCTIRKNDLGIVAIACGNLSIAHCAIDSNTTTGVYLEFMTSASLQADTVRYSPVGVFANNGSGGTLAAAARLISNELGVKCDHESDLVIRNTLITGSETGVAAMNDSDVDLGHASGTNCGASGSDQGLNSIHTNSDYYVANFTSTTLPAEGNYWGSQGPKASKFTGSAAVDYNPYICSNPLASSFQVAPPPPDGEPKPRLPVTYNLFASHPNPFNPTTTMRFDVPAPGGRVNIVIYDVSGARVRTLVSASLLPGVHQITWNGHDDRAAPAASGVYFVRMTATSFTRTRKVVLLK